MATGTTIAGTPVVGGGTPMQTLTPNGEQRRPLPAATASTAPPDQFPTDPGVLAYLHAMANAATGTGSTAPPDPAAAATTAANNDAIALISQELTSWGFGQDAVAWATSEIQSNKGVDQILFDLRDQPFYKTSIFGQTNAARAANGLGAMSEAQILAYQDYVTGDLTQAGVPKGFITTAELASLMGNDVSPAELDARITKGFVDATNADSDTRNALAAQGVDLGHLAAYYLDPNKALPFLQQQFLAAQVGGAATRTGYGAIAPTTMMDLAKKGVTASQAQTGFTDLAKQQQLFTPLPGSAEQAIGQPVQLAAEFGGNAEDQAAIKQRADQRTAAFSGSYRYAETQGRGITGLGQAPQNG